MSMERDYNLCSWKWILLLSLFLSLFSLVLSSQFPSQGSPMKVKDGCKKCENKMDDGDEFVCCTDCTYPEMIYGKNSTSTGYCKSGADLISQPKPKEVFRWVAGSWLPCSTLCGDGYRGRKVECYAVIEKTSSPDYAVYDDRCSGQEKLSTREPCNIRSCVTEVVNRNSKEDTGHVNVRRGKTSSTMWIITVFVMLIGVVVAVGFAGFILYTRRTSNLSNKDGYAYIMMEGFS